MSKNRPRQETAVHQMRLSHKYPLYKDPGWLWDQRWERGKTLEQIGACCGVSGETIGRYLTKYDINGRSHPWLHDHEILHDLYIRREMTAAEIADITCAGTSTVKMKLANFDIQKGDVWQPHTGLRYAGDYLYEEYWEKGKDARQIARQWGCDKATVLRNMTVLGIERRGEITKKEPTTIICDWCGKESKYNLTEKRQNEHHFCSGDCYGEWRSENIYAENHPQYKGGRDYKGKYWEQISHEIREKYDNECQICGVAQSEINAYLNVHHIIPFKQFDNPEKANKRDNLIPLCPSCHAKWEGIPLTPSRDN